MKKLSLKNMKLDGSTLLNSEQLKAITGGYYLRCGNGYSTSAISSCSEWAMWYFCQGNGGPVICVG
jgi:natural product precursor